MKPSQTLQAARDLISDPKRWTQGWFAKDDQGTDTHSLSPQAACWCSLGALTKAAGSGYYSRELGYLEKVLDAKTGQGVSQFNDSHTHAEVVEVFDEAIKLAKEAEK